VSKAAGSPEGARTRVWTYLSGIEKKDLQLTPFAEYQATVANEKETFRLVESINGLCPDVVPPEVLRRRFDSLFWPNFSKALADASGVQAPSSAASPPAPGDDLVTETLAEILRSLRSVQREIRRIPPQARSQGGAESVLEKLVLDELFARGVMRVTVTVAIRDEGATFYINGRAFLVPGVLAYQIANHEVAFPDAIVTAFTEAATTPNRSDYAAPAVV